MDDSDEKIPPNAIAFYRKKKGMTLMEVAELTGTNHQTIQRFETRKRMLSPEKAQKIAKALEVDWRDLGYSGEAHSYPWATKPVSVIGQIGVGMQVRPYGHTRLIGTHTSVSELGAAIELTAAAIPQIAGWFLIFDRRDNEQMSPYLLKNQTGQDRYISCLNDGTMWLRRIASGSRRHRYDLIAPGVDTIQNAEIEWVSPVIAIHPGSPLPLS
jgi:transcriptional regulator with XRE-family HTH domain